MTSKRVFQHPANEKNEFKLTPLNSSSKSRFRKVLEAAPIMFLDRVVIDSIFPFLFFFLLKKGSNSNKMRDSISRVSDKPYNEMYKGLNWSFEFGTDAFASAGDMIFFQ